MELGKCSTLNSIQELTVSHLHVRMVQDRHVFYEQAMMPHECQFQLSFLSCALG